MPTTPDRDPGVRSEEGAIFDRTVLATVPGEMRFDDTAGRWSLVDDSGEFDPRVGGGMSEAQHRALRELIHFIDDGPALGFASGAFKETTYSGAFPTSEIWWESAAKSDKIVEKTSTYTGAFPTTEVWKMYDTDGSTVNATITDSIVYSGAFESSRTRAIA